MALHTHFRDSDYKNWVRASLGLKLLKEGLVDYVDDEVKTFHRDILRNICGSATCNGCTTDELTRRHQPRPCTNNVCDKIRDKIQTEHRYSNPQWKNTDASRWCTNYWDIAKCFMSTGYNPVTSSADTDTSGILSVCINGLFMSMARQIVPAHLQPPVDIFHTNRNARNTILHSGYMSLSDTDRQSYIQDMISLLTTYKHQRDHVTQEAIDKLTELNTTGIIITSTDEVAALKLAQEATYTYQKTIKTQLDAMQEEQEHQMTNIRSIEDQQARADSSQHDLENKVDNMQREQEQHTTKFRSIEDKIEQKRQSLVLMKAILLELCTNTDENISHMLDKHKSLLEKNDELLERIRDLSSRVEIVERKIVHIEDDVQNVKDTVQNVEGDVRNVKDTVHNVEGDVRNVKNAVQNVEGDVRNVKDAVQNVEGDVRNVKDAVQNVEGDVRNVKNTVQNVEGKVQHVKDTLQNVDDRIQHVEDTMQKRNENSPIDKEEAKTEIKRYLLEKYEKDMKTMSMPPLLQRIKVNIDDVYTQLIIRDDLVHKKKRQTVGDEASLRTGNDGTINRNKEEAGIENYTDILHDGKKTCKNIFVVGNAGIGKTTWSRKLVCTWCEAMSQNASTKISNVNEAALLKYDLLFYIELRRAKRDYHIIDMIQNQYFPHPHQSALMTQVKTLMECDEDSSRILIVLDGLDEWVNRDSSSTEDGLPDRDPRWRSTIITTTRSWKLEELQLEPQKIDRAVEIKGLQKDGAKRLVKKVVATLNESNAGKHRDANEFESQCHRSIYRSLEVPLLLNIFVSLWYEEGRIDPLLSGTFCGLVELLIKYAEGSSRKGSFQKISPDTLDKAKHTWKEEHSSVPDCVAKRRLCSMYAPFLNRLGKIAFDNLFSSARESTLVFNYQSIQDIVSEEEQELALTIGLLSQTIHCGSILEEEFLLSFLHKTVQEYLAALYMVYDGTQSTACLNRYKEYCTDAYKVLEMENILMFVSGMFPEMAGKMSCHIAGMERNEAVHKLLLRCVRQEHITSSTSRHIYIKHHFLYPSYVSRGDTLDYNTDTVEALLSVSNDRDTTLCLNQGVEEEILKSIADIRHIKLVEAEFQFHGKQNMKLYFAEPSLQMSNKVITAEGICSQISLSGAYLRKLKISRYTSASKQHNLDLSGCNSLRTVCYKRSTATIQLPTEQLENVDISDYTPRTAPVLDLSECKSLRTVCYRRSTAPIQLLHTEQLENVDISGYTPSTAPVLDLSGCKSLKTVRYESSTAPIQLPTEQLEDVVIIAYTPSTAPVLDLSGCKSLKTVCYWHSTAPIQLPTEQLENVDIYGYTPSTAPVLDLSRCKSLKTVRYWDSTAPIQLPTEQLENVDKFGYTPNTAPVLDLSGCKSLKTVSYNMSTAPIQLPTEQLENVDIFGYTPSTAQVLDLSGCKYLKTVRYWQSTAPIQLPTEQLENVDIYDYTPSTAPVLDLSGCKSLKTVSYRRSTAPIQLPTEQLENVTIIAYTPSTAPVLDLSRCKSLKTVSYRQSRAPIQLPTEQLVEVNIAFYRPRTAPVLDLSGCKSLKIVSYWYSTAPIQLPTEQLEEVQIIDYSPSSAPVLDLSRCTSITSLRYGQSSVQIKLPTKPIEDLTTDESGRKLLLGINPQQQVNMLNWPSDFQ